MTSILYINPCLRPNAKVKYPPVGLACILTATKKAGFDFDLLDMDGGNIPLAELPGLLQGKTYDVVALGLIVSSFRLAKDLTEIVRRACPGAVIVVGNSVATAVPELLLGNTEADVAVIGEGDATIVDLLRCIERKGDLGQVDGIAFSREGKVVKTRRRAAIADLNVLGFPDWTLFDLKGYRPAGFHVGATGSGNDLTMPLNAARGCPYHCTFCYHVFKDDKYRKFSEASVVQEITRLHDRFGATFIHFWDELTFPSVPSVERMLVQLEELPFTIFWQGITRADLFAAKDVEMLKRLAKAGCRSMAFSIESASPEILAAMKKRLDLSRVEGNCAALKAAGITPYSSIIFGYPQETPETIAATLRVCEGCGVYPSAGFLQPLPGTEIYDWAVANGHIRDELDYLLQAGDRQDLHVNLTRMSTDELKNCVDTGMRELARKLGLDLGDPLKTGDYQKPKQSSSN